MLHLIEKKKTPCTINIQKKHKSPPLRFVVIDQDKKEVILKQLLFLVFFFTETNLLSTFDHYYLTNVPSQRFYKNGISSVYAYISNVL